MGTKPLGLIQYFFTVWYFPTSSAFGFKKKEDKISNHSHYKNLNQSRTRE